MFSNFSDELKKILVDARKEMHSLKHSFVGTEHIVLSILKRENNISNILNKFKINYSSFKKNLIELVGYGNESKNLFVFTPLVKKILEDSMLISQDSKTDVTLNTFFLSLLNEGEGVAYRIFLLLNLDLDEVANLISNNTIKEVKPKYIEEIGANLNKLVEESKFDPVVGRDDEISRLIDILLRKNKSNPLLVGAPGVGKTAIVEGLAKKIVDEDVPNKLIGKKIYSISMASLVSGTKYRGEFEEKLLKIIKEAENNSNIIIFIDEIHTLVGAGGSDGAIDASNILKPALSRGNIKIIGATTIDEYKKYIEDDKALSRRFQIITVNEIKEDILMDVLKKLKPIYEKFHKVIVDDDILKYIINVSKKYFLYKKEPDKSIDVLDEVCSKVSSSLDSDELVNIRLKKDLKDIIIEKNKCLKHNNYEEALKYRENEREIESKINCNLINLNKIKKVRKEDVDNVLSIKLGIELCNKNKALSIYKKKVNEFNSLVIGQEEIINGIFDKIKQIFITDYIINRPISVVFYGKIGNGRNYVLSLLSEKVFNNTIRINLNEYTNEYSINKILGSNIGYNSKNGVFESIKENPISLIIFDNFDSCCFEVKKIIYQIIETGYFMDCCGCKYFFNNCFIVFNVNYNNSRSVGFNNTINNLDDTSLFSKVTKVFEFNELTLSQIKLVIKRKLNSNNDKIINKIINECDYKSNGCKNIDFLIEKYCLSLA